MCHGAERRTRRRFGRGGPIDVSYSHHARAPAYRATRCFSAFRHLRSRTARRAFLPRHVCDNDRTLSDRTLKKAKDENYVRHPESSIKTITRKNFGWVDRKSTRLNSSHVSESRM